MTVRSVSSRRHEAVAATQAAIWHFTNGLAMHIRPLNVPVAVRGEPGSITFEFDGKPQLGGYALWTDSVQLQKQAKAIAWQDVSRSHLATAASTGAHKRTLGVGSAFSASRRDRAERGYHYYRLITTTPATAASTGRVEFWLTGPRHYRNADRVARIYNYLLSGACNAVENPEDLRLVDDHTTAESELIGSFQVPMPLTLGVSDGHISSAPTARPWVVPLQRAVTFTFVQQRARRRRPSPATNSTSAGRPTSPVPTPPKGIS